MGARVEVSCYGRWVNLSGFWPVIISTAKFEGPVNNINGSDLQNLDTPNTTQLIISFNYKPGLQNRLLEAQVDTS